VKKTAPFLADRRKWKKEKKKKTEVVKKLDLRERTAVQNRRPKRTAGERKNARGRRWSR